MKTTRTAYYLTLITLILLTSTSWAQERQKIAEKRAIELHKAFTELPRDQRSDFVKKNYSEEFLDKYEVKMHTDMLNNISRDFKESEIANLTYSAKGIQMVIKRKADGHVVTFEINIQQEKPYMIEGLSIEAGELGR